MYVREKDGRYAGEIREFPPDIARQLIESGRGENPYAEPVPVPEQPIGAQTVATPTTSAKRQRAS